MTALPVCAMPRDRSAPHRLLRGLLALLWLAWTALAPCPATAAFLSDGTVAMCFDGDTVKLTDRRVVRLAGIDAPEVGHGRQPGQYYSRTSQKRLVALTRGVKVRLEVVSAQSRDRYGRLVADVRLPDGRSLSDIMVAEGAAFVYPHKDLDPRLAERLLKLQRQAIAERRGLWKRLLDLPEARTAYVGNRQSQRFFALGNAYALQIKARNRIVFGNLMDAFMTGYAPARPCAFWPLEP